MLGVRGEHPTNVQYIKNMWRVQYNWILLSLKQKNYYIQVITQIHLKNIMLNKSRQTQKITYWMSPFIWRSRQKSTSQKLEQWLLGIRGAGEIDCKGAQGNFFGCWKYSINWLCWWSHQCICCSCSVSPGVCSNSCLLSRWHYPTISSSASCNYRLNWVYLLHVN